MTQNTKTVDFASYIGLNQNDAWFAIAGEYFANTPYSDVDIVSLYQNFALSRGTRLHDVELTITYEETADVKEMFAELLSSVVRFKGYQYQPVFFRMAGRCELPVLMDMIGLEPRVAIETERQVFAHHQDFAGVVKVVKFRLMGSEDMTSDELKNTFADKLKNSGIHIQFSQTTFNLI